jgi:hypothetical protein
VLVVETYENGRWVTRRDGSQVWNETEQRYQVAA